MGRTSTPAHSQKAYFLINVHDVKHMDDLKGRKTKPRNKKNVQEVIKKIKETLVTLQNELNELEHML